MTLFDLTGPARRKRWAPRCDDCGRRIWATRSLIRWRGLLLGGQCYRKRRAHHKRITFTPPGHIPGQLDLTDQDTP